MRATLQRNYIIRFFNNLEYYHLISSAKGVSRVLLYIIAWVKFDFGMTQIARRWSDEFPQPKWNQSWSVSRRALFKIPKLYDTLEVRDLLHVYKISLL